MKIKVQTYRWTNTCSTNFVLIFQFCEWHEHLAFTPSMYSSVGCTIKKKKGPWMQVHNMNKLDDSRQRSKIPPNVSFILPLFSFSCHTLSFSQKGTFIKFPPPHTKIMIVWNIKTLSAYQDSEREPHRYKTGSAKPLYCNNISHHHQ
jgi:hypothetical protein